MVNEKYLLIAEDLAERNRNRLNKKYSPKEQETEELFYWIMSRLEWATHSYFQPQTSNKVVIKVGRCYEDGRVLLEHGRMSDYLSTYVTGKEFYSVMNDVANIFNEIGKSVEKGYCFYATCLVSENPIESAELTVLMITRQ